MTMPKLEMNAITMAEIHKIIGALADEEVIIRFGYINTKDNSADAAKRDDETVKVYGIILTRTTTKLIHLDLVPDMSTNQPLLALRRFYARQGVPASVMSDN
ncbi:hypothetical protein RB195_023063 [Necator americanus]|uniref:Integrase catalytic domain-containing protein n=1 Tax=Necator americanus TaxID=51031 RepID=A0ABR1EHQ2_NECAM